MVSSVMLEKPNGLYWYSPNTLEEERIASESCLFKIDVMFFPHVMTT